MNMLKFWLQNSLVSVTLITTLIVVGLWGACERMDRIEAERKFAEADKLYISVHKQMLEDQDSQKKVNDRWTEHYQEASDRANMWLAKYNELRDAAKKKE